MKNIKLVLCIIMMGFIINSCKKNDTTTATSTSTTYSVSMTDSPGPYDAVYIDLQGVEITGNDGKAVLINVHAGIYNLLNFTDGVDTLIATGTLTGEASVEQIRLILGTNNSVVVNNVTYPLSTPSGDQSGLKLQVHQVLQSGVAYSVLLDFDANASIVDLGNGNYKLKPVIRTIETALTGAIKGTISPISTLAFVAAVSGNVTFDSNVSLTGGFLIEAVPAGTYTVIVTPALPLHPDTINNVVVTTGVTTDIGIVTLH